MKQAVLHGAGDLRLDEVPAPHAGDRDVVLQVKAAGICGTDLGFYAGGFPTGAPVPLGHELAGVIVEAGKEVTGYKVGDRVVLNPLVNMVGNGGPEGGFAERLLIRDVAAQPASLIPIPDAMSFEAGALAEPLAVSLHAANRSQVEPGARAAIFGAGPIGLGLVVALRARGVDDIVVFDLSPFRRERAMELGARAAFDPRDKAPVDVLKELHGIELFFGVIPVAGTDVFFEASGAPHIVPEIVGYGKLGSTIVLVANHKKPVEIDLAALGSKEMSIIASMGYPSELTDAVAMLAQMDVPVDALVSHRFPGEDLLEAFAMARQPDRATKVLVRYS